MTRATAGDFAAARDRMRRSEATGRVVRIPTPASSDHVALPQPARPGAGRPRGSSLALEMQASIRVGLLLGKSVNELATNLGVSHAAIRTVRDRHLVPALEARARVSP